MPEWRRIGCAVDFSETSRIALEEGARLANRLGGEIILIHVVAGAPAMPEPVFAPPPVHPPPDDFPAELGAWAALAGQLGRVPVHTVTARGRAAPEIARIAEAEHLDLLVVGTHGRSGARRLVLGSVAEEVVRIAPCPVLVARRRGASDGPAQGR